MKSNHTPEIRFSGFVQNWEQHKLLDNVERVLDFRGKSPVKFGMKWGKSGYLVLSALNVKNGYIDKNLEAKYGNQALYERWMGKEHLEKGDVVFTTEAPLGNVAQIPDDNLYILNQRAVGFKTKEEETDNNFLAQLMRSPFFQRKLKASATGGTAKGIGMKEFAKLEVIVPTSVEEQKKIGGFFKKIDETITLHQQELATLKQTKQGFLQKMFPKEGESLPELRFPGFNEGWQLHKLNEVAEIIGGGTPKSGVSEYWNGNIDWYSPTEIGKEIYAFGSRRRITDLGLKKSSAKILPASKTILFTSRAGIGDMAILKKDGATNQGFQSLVINSDYDVYFVYSLGFKIKEYALKNSAGSTFQEISGRVLGEMDLFLPTFEEQSVIGAFFKKLDEIINIIQQELEALKQTKKAFLQKMFI